MYVLNEEVFFSPSSRLLSSCGGEHRSFLTENKSDLLAALIGGTIEKEALIHQIWGTRGVIVTDSSYYKTLHTLRAQLQAFGTTGIKIKTIPRVGASLICSITLSEECPITTLDTNTPSTAITDGDITHQSLVVEQQEYVPIHEKTVKKLVKEEPHLQKSKALTEILSLSLVVLLAVSSFFLFSYQPDEKLKWISIKISGLGHARFQIEQGDPISPHALRKKLQTTLPNTSLNGDIFLLERTRSSLIISCKRSIQYKNPLCKNYLTVPT